MSGPLFVLIVQNGYVRDSTSQRSIDAETERPILKTVQRKSPRRFTRRNSVKEGGFLLALRDSKG